MAEKKKSAYAEAGVDIDVMMNSLKRIGKKVKATNTPGVVSELGSFGGLFKSPGKENLIVSSVDGVGTKLKVAHMAGKHNTIGQDLVNHCVNDILVQGAYPLFFLDYLGTAALDPKVFEAVIDGFCKACAENGAALLGGETAEMPGLYPPGEYDVVGTIVGTVERKNLITGEKIRKGDVLIGLPSTGLQTNGYSLARKVIFEKAGKLLSDLVPGTKTTFEKVLLAIHKSYLHPVMKLMDKVSVHGMAHITGGGLYDNVPRVLPKNVDAVFDRSTWKTPPIFQFIEEAGKVDHEEMYRVFNMGIGYVIVVAKKDVEQTLKILKAAKQPAIIIGNVVPGSGKSVLIN
ncbi:MAG: phosphoribosylformylglycinamidine cyclo-ligase [Kiritimatiellales bacterium]|nr:phosphoribosylformylglycinamidine cyclo-ligase [Kiritimatiellales bacterium]MCF7863940.1 phosphoribosylformylglycinamidine cyclo-ligase [Kiritimatiellales bacterium]